MNIYEKRQVVLCLAVPSIQNSPIAEDCVTTFVRIYYL